MREAGQHAQPRSTPLFIAAEIMLAVANSIGNPVVIVDKEVSGRSNNAGEGN